MEERNVELPLLPMSFHRLTEQSSYLRGEILSGSNFAEILTRAAMVL